MAALMTEQKNSDSTKDLFYISKKIMVILHLIKD